MQQSFYSMAITTGVLCVFFLSGVLPMPKKPSAQIAMQQLIQQVRTALPFDQPASFLCQKHCIGCPKKLMEFLESEISSWETALDQGETPTLGDIEQLARTSRKIHTVMVKNGLAGEKP